MIALLLLVFLLAAFAAYGGLAITPFLWLILIIVILLLFFAYGPSGRWRQ